MCVWYPEDTYQEDVEHNTFPVSRGNQIASMKHKGNRMWLAHLAAVPYHLEPTC